jgi:hypothetical protein
MSGFYGQKVCWYSKHYIEHLKVSENGSVGVPLERREQLVYCLILMRASPRARTPVHRPRCCVA